VEHPAIKYFKFTVGGKDFDDPALNGQFYNVVQKIGPGAFIDGVDAFNAYVAR